MHVCGAVNLIELQWGYMLNHPNSTNSTFWEGYYKNGTFAYQGIYMSNAHGWATGPTSALTFFVLGIRPTWARGSRYDVMPQPSGLRHARGQLTLDPEIDGVVAVTWTVTAADATTAVREFRLTVDSTAHPKGRGRVGVPADGSLPFSLSHTHTHTHIHIFNFQIHFPVCSVGVSDAYYRLL
jgi:hypothetical protein